MNSFETMDPFFTLRALAAYVEHVVVELAKLKQRLGYACRPET